MRFFCEIRNNQGRGKCYTPKPRVEADTALPESLIISDITKTDSNNCIIIIHCFKENNDKRIIVLDPVYFRHAMFLLRCP